MHYWPYVTGKETEAQESKLSAGGCTFRKWLRLNLNLIPLTFEAYALSNMLLFCMETENESFILVWFSRSGIPSLSLVYTLLGCFCDQ